ncbi:MAG: nucleotide exchange factor GrpE [Paludibacter sp.]
MKKKQTLNEEELKNTVEPVENEVDSVEPVEEAAKETETSEIEGTDETVAKIEELEQKCADLNDKNLRLMAEFDNYRKRTLKERSELIKTAGESILVNMLPLVDDFERGKKAMETSEDIQALKEGIDLIYNKFVAFLLQNGVKAIPTENENFDTDLHEAITTFPAPTEELKGKIIDCVSKGYTMNEKVIRFSKVVVGE